mgnify:FL=1
MAKVELTAELRAEYRRLWGEARILPKTRARVREAALRISRGEARYRQTCGLLGIPWWWGGAVHELERGCRWDTHLHNGDPLTARTTHVPKGRPIAGKPPYTWEASAYDALANVMRVDRWQDWSVEGALFQWERFNGFGYRLYHPGHVSSYLWACTSQQTPGKYVGDRKWSATAWSDQVGAAAALRMLVELGRVGGI